MTRLDVTSTLLALLALLVGKPLARGKHVVRYPRHERICLGPLAPPEASGRFDLGPRVLVCMACGAPAQATREQLRQAARAELAHWHAVVAGDGPVARVASERRTYARRGAQRALWPADVLSPALPAAAPVAAPPAPAPTPLERELAELAAVELGELVPLPPEVQAALARATPVKARAR